MRAEPGRRPTAHEAGPGRTRERAGKRVGKGEALADWFDGRIGLFKMGKAQLRKVFPDHWSYLIGEVALYSFLIIILTGVYLTMFFVPSMGEIVYRGSYVPMDGIRMSQAFASTLDISFDVRGGLLMRQIHHWAAIIFVA
ncbi:ubiquinol-cytochrome c reductase cytochrome b subunit, partial [Streptomyces sp. MCAF7]